MGVSIRAGRSLNIQMGNYRPSGASGDRWLQEIAEGVTKKIETLANRRIDTSRFETEINLRLQGIMQDAQKMVAQNIVGRMTSSTVGSGQRHHAAQGTTSFSLNAMNAPLPYYADTTLSRRSGLRGRALFSNRMGGWQHQDPPWLGDAATRAVTVRWQNLAPSTVKQKAKQAHSNRLRFFKHHDQLQSILRSAAVPGKLVSVSAVKFDGRVNRHRDSRGRFTKFTPDSILLKQMRITILPNVPRAIASGLLRGKWDHEMAFERWLGLDELSLRKLGGRKISHPVRHLLQPVYSYYLRRAVPGAISIAIQRATL